jgi:tRNA modification GTPase
MRDTIFALASGAVPCAVAVIRISGQCAGNVAEALLGLVPDERRVSFCAIRDPLSGELIDRGLAFFFAGPKSFTGEDCLELQVHGSRAVISRLLRVLMDLPGLRHAEPGEFIRRAFDNGKASLVEVEGFADLIDARSEGQRRQALSQAGGFLSQKAHVWRNTLVDCLGLIAAEIDFVDEGEAPSNVATEVRERLEGLLFALRSALESASRGELIRSGIRVVIAGKPNAGKSSLLNSLVQREAAIVTDVAGTTRDVIEVEVELGGQRIILCDTAGIRETSDAVETIGIDRARLAVRGSSLVLWLCGATEEDNKEPIEVEGKRVLYVATKMDIAPMVPPWADIAISSKSGLGIPELLYTLSDFASNLVAGEQPLVTNERQYACVALAIESIENCVGLEALELLSDQLQTAASAMDVLLGRIDMEDVLSSVFSRFCMGK